MKKIIVILGICVFTFGCSKAEEILDKATQTPSDASTNAIPVDTEKLDGGGESLSGCEDSFVTDSLCMDVEWLVGPHTRSSNTLTVRFEQNGTTATPAWTVVASAVYLSNPSGTVSEADIFPLEVVPTQDAQGNYVLGSYTVSGIRFISGDWTIVIGLEDTAGNIVEEKSPLELEYIHIP